MRLLLALLLLYPALVFGHHPPPVVSPPPVVVPPPAPTPEPAPQPSGSSFNPGPLVFIGVAVFFYVAICTKEKEVNPDGWFARNCLP